MSFIPVNEPSLCGNENKYLAECVDTGWISSEGSFVRKFEEQFSKCVGKEHGIAVCNGTAALDVAVKALGIGPGDEVILPSFTIISCAAAIVRAGATPVVVDSDFSTWNMDVEHVAQKITSRTKAIMVVHIYGLPVDMGPVLDLAKDKGLYIIEDAAEAIGQDYRGKPCGSFGHVSTFSFYPNKHITTGEGGMVVTNDPELAERCRSLRNLCFQKGNERFIHRELGWNFRMTNLQAAVGMAQLEKLDDNVNRKRWIGQTYNKLLKDVPGLHLPLERTEYSENIYWIYGVVLEDHVSFNASEAITRLSEMGVGCRPFFWPMHKQPVFNDMGLFEGEQCPVAERLAERGFYIPSGLALTPEQLEVVARSVKKIMM